MNFIELKQKYSDKKITKAEFIQAALAIHEILFEYIEAIKGTDVQEILITDEGVSFIVGSQNIRLHCPPKENRVAPIEIMNFDEYEPEAMRVIDLLVSDANNIFDIGANIGFYSLHFAKKLPDTKIFSFEPMPISYSYLQRNIAANNAGNQVAAFNYGLSEANSIVDFFVAPSKSTNASLRNVACAPDALAVVGVTLTLDQWVRNYGHIPDFIKCDVEGAELLVFRGAKATLEQYHPVIFTEMLRKWTKPFGYQPNDVIAYFDGLGYRCYGINNNGVRNITTVHQDTVETNYVFVHQQSHSKLLNRLDSWA